MSCRKIFNFRQYVGSSSSSVFLNQFSLGKRHLKNERLVL
ncbi:hypothetical protein LEP1GSC075_2948 [Leptospira interrogans str. Kito]|nr:hypothetical protein LEP1GSC069_2632 [Leptospira interrogans serovar Canicola str. Fiocruz LV133]EMK18841.1 hypothetical protein LEP1GSC075_2948 [Leptospira interrogans str. Kito]EMN76074.1 hypothetical protein LEP1GSC102_3136 [Leptospira interrogans str. UI 09600]